MTPSTVSQIVLALVALECRLRFVTADMQRSYYANIGFTVTCINAILLLLEDLSGNRLYSTHQLFNVLHSTFVLPCFTTALWYNYGIIPEIAYIHIGLGLIPLYYHLFLSNRREDLINFVILFNIVSMAGLGLLFLNYCALKAAFSCYLAYFSFKRNETLFDINPQIFFNYAITAYLQYIFWGII